MSDSIRKTITTVWANAAAPTEITEPVIGKQDAGWTAEKPPYQNFNWAWQVFTNMLQNAEQNGIMEWKSTTEYSDGGWAKGSDGSMYISQTAANTGNDPVSDAVNWFPAFGTPTAFTPTLYQNGVVASSVTNASYIKNGNIITIRVAITATGSGTGGSQIEVRGLPEAANAAALVGSFRMTDDSEVDFYAGTSDNAGSTTAVVLYGPNRIGVSPAIALGSGDVIKLSITYEAA